MGWDQIPSFEISPDTAWLRCYWLKRGELVDELDFCKLWFVRQDGFILPFQVCNHRYVIEDEIRNYSVIIIIIIIGKYEKRS